MVCIYLWWASRKSPLVVSSSEHTQLHFFFFLHLFRFRLLERFFIFLHVWSCCVHFLVRHAGEERIAWLAIRISMISPLWGLDDKVGLLITRYVFFAFSPTAKGGKRAKRLFLECSGEIITGPHKAVNERKHKTVRPGGDRWACEANVHAEEQRYSNRPAICSEWCLLFKAVGLTAGPVLCHLLPFSRRIWPRFNPPPLPKCLKKQPNRIIHAKVVQDLSCIQCIQHSYP